jgi:hypothetical protein
MLENRYYWATSDMQNSKYQKCTQNIWGKYTGKRSLKDSFKTDLCVDVEAEFYVHGSVHREPVSITVQQDATLYSFYSLQTARHVSGDTFTHHQVHE